MTPDLFRELQALREEAGKKLLNASVVTHPNNLFSLFIRPSFHPWQRVTVLFPKHQNKSDNGTVSHATWRSDLDTEKFRDPVERLRHGKAIEPTIEDVSWEIKKTSLVIIQDKLSQITIPLFTKKKSIGLDGISYELISRDFSLNWWEDTPSEWQPLTKTVLELCENLISQQSPTS